MSDYSNYDEVVQKILDSRPAVEEEYKRIGDGATTLCDINGTFVQIPGATVVRDNGGNVIGYDYHYTGPNLPDTDIINIDSNTDSGWYAEGGGGQTGGGGAGRFRSSEYSGGIQTDPTSTDKMTTGGQVSGFLSPAWALVSTLAKFGKNTASSAADFIENTADAFADTFHDVLTRAGDAGASAVRALFGVESDGTTSMYIDEDTIGAAAIALRDAGAFNSTGKTPPQEWTDTKVNGPIITMPFVADNTFTYNGDVYKCMLVGHGTHPSYGDIYDVYLSINEDLYNKSPILGLFNDGTVSDGQIIAQACFAYNTARLNNHSVYLLFYNRGTQAISYGSNLSAASADYTYDNKFAAGCATTNLSRRYYPSYTITVEYFITAAFQSVASNFNYNIYADRAPLIWTTMYGSAQGLPGITDQTGATSMVDAVTGADPHVVGQNLATQYPSVMGTPLQIVVMDDSCNQVTKNYYKVPISYSPTNVTANIPITGGTQISPSFNPNTSIDLPDINLDNYIEQIINQLGGSGAGRDVTTTDDDGNPETLPTDIPNTGTGVTPPEVLPETNVNAMWHVYNPSSAELSALGSWLWSSSIIDQITRLFNNPMESIIGVHAVYGEPSVTSATAIVVGNLTSTVSARVVSAQYTTVDCGSVWLTEHFGSAFDYDPYTKVSLFLPFIGIVRLNTADVMRAELHVLYNIDVYSGACIAMVEVKRDGVGGVLYQFSGSCAVSYPVSGAAYNNIFSGMLSLSLGIAAVASAATGAGAALSARAGAGIATGAILGASKMGVADVSRSGSFSGNAGAMGIKKPYLIITRPQTNMAINYEKYDGRGSNYTSRVADCRGYIKCKEVHLSVPGAYKEELDEIERLLKEGVRLPD